MITFLPLNLPNSEDLNAGKYLSCWIALYTTAARRTPQGKQDNAKQTGSDSGLHKPFFIFMLHTCS